MSACWLHGRSVCHNFLKCQGSYTFNTSIKAIFCAITYAKYISTDLEDERRSIALVNVKVNHKDPPHQSQVKKTRSRHGEVVQQAITLTNKVLYTAMSLNPNAEYNCDRFFQPPFFIALFSHEQYSRPRNTKCQNKP